MNPGGRISGQRLATVLGAWRRGARHGSADLAAAIEMQVLDGLIPVGTRLPAERELADALGVSRTLIGAALDRLREGGLVASRRGAGSWITAPRTGGIDPAVRLDGDVIDLARATPPAVPGMTAAVDAARRLLAAELRGTGYTGFGMPLLRERIARRYTERGLPTSPAQIMITNGAHHAFVLTLRMLAGPGDRVLVEQPTYPNTLDAIRAAHALPVPVAMTEDGWDFDGIEAVLRQAAPRLAFLIVDFQNPTGWRMDDDRRERLGRMFARARTPLVIDETLAEVDLGNGAAPTPLSGAILLGSSSKSHWGGLRLGWIRAAEDVLARLSSARFGVDLGSPVFEQLVFAELLTHPPGGRWDELRAQRDVLTGAVREYCPDWTFQVPGGGLSLWCKLPEPMSTRLAVAAASHGVQVAPGSRFGAHGGLERWMRLPYSQPPDRLVEAVRRLSVAAASVRGGVADVPVT